MRRAAGFPFGVNGLRHVRLPPFGGNRLHLRIRRAVPRSRTRTRRAQGVWLSVLSIPLLVLLAFAAFALVDVAAHAPEVAAGEKAYIAIYVPGGFFTILSGVLAGLLTGQGRTGWVSVCGVVGVLVNIALSPIFIDGWGPVPAMGNAGAAIAGVISFASIAAL